jgi:Tol biopolymer transport system component
VFPIAFSPDGALLYFATLSASGSDLYSVAPDGSGETKIAHLSDEIAREWQLSPDGATLAYSVAETGASPRIVAMKLDLASGVATQAVANVAALDDAQTNPTWRNNAELTVSSIDPSGGGDALSVGGTRAAHALTDNDDSIDLPLQWSPDGSSLAVRAIEGASANDVGVSHIDLVTAEGERARLSDAPDALMVGWMK